MVCQLLATAVNSGFGVSWGGTPMKGANEHKLREATSDQNYEDDVKFWAMRPSYEIMERLGRCFVLLLIFILVHCLFMDAKTTNN